MQSIQELFTFYIKLISLDIIFNKKTLGEKKIIIRFKMNQLQKINYKKGVPNAIGTLRCAGIQEKDSEMEEDRLRVTGNNE